MWTDPATLAAIVAGITGLITAITGLITAFKGHSKANTALTKVEQVAEEIQNGKS